tara:strand:+ start:45368 stop:46483 length:1116 start_codon:yes stop_codon:yes gene_type:complete
MQSLTRVLIVDDNPVNCEICVEILEADFRTRVASSGEEAIAIAESFEPDIILLDIMMPGMDGLEVCRRIRNSTRPWTKIILVSAKSQLSDRLAGYDAGADDYITKPFDEEELLAKINVAVRMKGVEEIDDVKHRLLDVMQHGTRTPLTHIVANADLLANMGEMLTSDERRQQAETISNSATQLAHWVTAAEQLMAFKTGRVQFESEQRNLAAVVRELAGHEPFASEESGIKIRVHGDDELVAEIDVEFFELMVSSLVREATAQCLDGHEVTIFIGQRPQGVACVSVTRSGKPISAELMPEYFELFSSFDDVIDGQSDGISLAIAREIALFHNGSIRAKNLPDGRVMVEAQFPLNQAAAWLTETADPQQQSR